MKLNKTLFVLLLVACGGADSADQTAQAGDSASVAPAAAQPAPTAAAPAGSDTLQPNELGRIPVLEYHLIGDKEARWERERGQFRKDLELLYARGYRPITASELVDKKIDLPRGLSPIVFTF